MYERVSILSVYVHVFLRFESMNGKCKETGNIYNTFFSYFFSFWQSSVNFVNFISFAFLES